MARILVALLVLIAGTTIATAQGSSGPRIVVYSASLAAAYRLPSRQGLVPRLQAALDRRGVAVTMINRSRSGRTTAGGVRRFSSVLSARPDGVLLSLGGNDFLRGIPLEQTRRNLDRMLRQLRQRGIAVLLVGLDIQSRRPRLNRRIAAMYRSLARKHGALFHPGFIRTIQSRPANVKPDGIHPTAQGVEAMVATVLPKVVQLVKRARAS